MGLRWTNKHDWLITEHQTCTYTFTHLFTPALVVLRNIGAVKKMAKWLDPWQDGTRTTPTGSHKDRKLAKGPQEDCWWCVPVYPRGVSCTTRPWGNFEITNPTINMFLDQKPEKTNMEMGITCICHDISTPFDGCVISEWFTKVLWIILILVYFVME